MSLPLPGRIPPPVRLRSLLLQARHGLSDPAPEADPEATLVDRLSFCRFLGVRLDEPTPNHQTLWCFRGHLARLDLAARLFTELHRHLENHGVVLRAASFIDATLIEAKLSAKNQRQYWRPVDLDARCTRRGKWPMQGNTMHGAVV